VPEPALFETGGLTEFGGAVFGILIGADCAGTAEGVGNAF
jgi:hypothetical protein